MYGTAFLWKEALQEHLKRLEEARARDHRKLGRELGLFFMSDLSPGSPFWQPAGMVIWNELTNLWRTENARRGYLEVKTPLIYDKALWVTSGHWEKFRENMFLIPGDVEDQTYGIKPMNCPGHMLLFGSELRSYRDLPIRYAEAAPLHRNELTGTLHGLTRVRYKAGSLGTCSEPRGLQPATVRAYRAVVRALTFDRAYRCAVDDGVPWIVLRDAVPYCGSEPEQAVAFLDQAAQGEHAQADGERVVAIGARHVDMAAGGLDAVHERLHGRLQFELRKCRGLVAQQHAERERRPIALPGSRLVGHLSSSGCR
jgi:hypothetical protein